MHGLTDSNNTPIPFGAIMYWKGTVQIRSSKDKDELYLLESINGATLWILSNDFLPIEEQQTSNFITIKL